MADAKKSTLPKNASKHFTSSEAKSTGAIESISNIFKAEAVDNDETLIDIKISNPLHKIIAILKDIKRHQATTFSLKFTIPLIALPVFLLAAFQIGRLQTMCTPQMVTNIGILRKISIEVPENNNGIIQSIIDLFVTVPKLKAGTILNEEDRTILIKESSETVKILHTQNIKVDEYENREVLVTGNFSTCTNVMTLESQKNIELND